MPQTHDILKVTSTDRLGLFGQPGTGKTKLFQYLATLVPEERLMIYDPLDQYGQFPDRCREVPKDSNATQEVNDFCRRMMARGNVTVFVEEAQQYLPESHKIGDHTAAMLNRGRNYGIGVFVSSQRIQDITKRFFDLAQTIIFFRCGFTSRSYIGALLPKDAAMRINRLQDRQFLYYDLRTENYNVSTLKFPQDRPPTDGTIPPTVKIESVK